MHIVLFVLTVFMSDGTHSTKLFEAPSLAQCKAAGPTLRRQILDQIQGVRDVEWSCVEQTRQDNP